jgi:hypothetical protein
LLERPCEGACGRGRCSNSQRGGSVPTGRDRNTCRTQPTGGQTLRTRRRGSQGASYIVVNS